MLRPRPSIRRGALNQAETRDGLRARPANDSSPLFSAARDRGNTSGPSYPSGRGRARSAPLEQKTSRRVARTADSECYARNNSEFTSPPPSSRNSNAMVQTLKMLMPFNRRTQRIVWVKWHCGELLPSRHFRSFDAEEFLGERNLGA
jgi:hypothetical protein